VIIPIYDLDGELVSFQGRDITGTAAKKYLFPPGFASTGKYLYNGHNANMSQSAVLCEGAFDVFAAKKALDEDVTMRDIVAIGSFGKHLTNSGGGDQIGELIKLKNKRLKKICIAWDGEYLAAKAAIDTALTLNSCGLKASVAFLPKGCDPNEIPAHLFRKAYIESVTINKSTAMTALYKAKSMYR
jgi:DNA primase